MQHQRLGIDKLAIAAVLVLIVVVAGIGVYLGSSALNTSTTSHTTSSSSTGSGNISTTQGGAGSSSTSGSSGGLTITNMYADIVGFGLQAAASNSSSVADRSSYSGPAGQSFQVAVDYTYSLCAAGSCPTEITAVVAQTPGFLVQPPTVPPMPVTCLAQTEATYTCDFTVTVQPPSGPYTGTLTLIAQG